MGVSKDLYIADLLYAVGEKLGSDVTSPFSAHFYRVELCAVPVVRESQITLQNV